ncbi:hypothetical protein [Streptomyces smyrnaeus]|uniref:hypothetical protein n=1 Tax=Streptomyces smyrnaeus TaxID=1387713 RepID=UPI00368A5168
MEFGETDGGGFVVAGGRDTSLFEAVDAALDGTALLVGVAAEDGWSSADPAATLTVGGLLRGLWNHHPDTSPAQMLSNGTGVRRRKKDRHGSDLRLVITDLVANWCAVYGVRRQRLLR